MTRKNNDYPQTDVVPEADRREAVKLTFADAWLRRKLDEIDKADEREFKLTIRLHDMRMKLIDVAFLGVMSALFLATGTAFFCLALGARIALKQPMGLPTFVWFLFLGAFAVGFGTYVMRKMVRQASYDLREPPKKDD